MKVKEMLEELKHCDPELEVVFTTLDSEYNYRTLFLELASITVCYIEAKDKCQFAFEVI